MKGIPKNWTLAERGQVSRESFDQLFPKLPATQAQVEAFQLETRGVFFVSALNGGPTQDNFCVCWSGWPGARPAGVIALAH